jgi:cell division septation protein DedD
MEQKKILWIVVAISVFVLIIFGTALILYAPSRSSVASREASIAAPGSGNAGKQNIDPDSWVRDPNKTPGLDSAIPAGQGDINLTIVNGDNAGANYGTLDVNGLTKTPFGKPGDPLVQTPLGIPGQDDPAATGKTPTEGTTSQAATETTKVTTTTVTTEKNTKAQATTKAQSAKVTTATAKTTSVKTATGTAKAAQAKPVSVTEYWIQTGSFSSKINAEKARETLTARYLAAEIFTKDQAGKTSYRVRVGPYKTKTEAEYWLGTITEIKDFGGSYVSEVKAKK